jgi:hypothetical protein
VLIVKEIVAVGGHLSGCPFLRCEMSLPRSMESILLLQSKLIYYYYLLFGP